MENEENRKQVFHRFPQPLEIATRLPHSHSPGDDRVEKWKSKIRIPTFPARLMVPYKLRKEDPLDRQILYRSGSSLD
jgi:hypothetical protein